MRIKVPERHCTFVYDPKVFSNRISKTKVVRLTGITEDLHTWLVQRSYHYSVEESEGAIFVDFLDGAAAIDFRMTWT